MTSIARGVAAKPDGGRVIAIWVSAEFWAWRSVPPSGRIVVGSDPCWRCGREQVRLYWIEPDGTVHSEYYLANEEAT